MPSNETDELILLAGEFESGVARVTKPDGTIVMFAIHPKTKKWVEIDPEQAWFWAEEWQIGERRAEEDLKRRNFQDFDDVDDFFDAP
jgi:hypothetical protein